MTPLGDATPSRRPRPMTTDETVESVRLAFGSIMLNNDALAAFAWDEMDDALWEVADEFGLTGDERAALRVAADGWKAELRLTVERKEAPMGWSDWTGDIELPIDPETLAAIPEPYRSAFAGKLEEPPAEAGGEDENEAD